jgi:outer membrane protein OmpA-like peptidoglycan-associated protein
VRGAGSRESRGPVRLDPGSVRRFEREADHAALKVLAPRQAPPALSLAGLPAGPRLEEEPLTTGRPLERDDRSFFESRFGHDFSQVRVHSSSQRADELQARAYTSGDDITFAQGELRPDMAEGKQLLAHELAHTIQQQGAGGSIEQRKPPEGEEQNKPENIGDKPPGEKFDRSSGKAAEEDFFLFDQNKAELAAGAAKKLEALVAKHKGTLVVEIHGYASQEGKDEYNFNLAAHRAAAVKAAILPLLPSGATVNLYSHGHTDVFGPRPQNRRAGVQITEQPAPKTAGVDVPPVIVAAPGDAPLGSGFGYKPNIDLGLKYTAPVVTKFDPAILAPTPGSSNEIDWISVVRPFSSRGVRLTDRDYTAVGAQWNMTVSLFVAAGANPAQAKKAANVFAPLAWDIQMANEAPTTFDISEKERKIDEKIRGGWSTPNIPLISPFTIKLLTKGKVDLSF